MPKETERSRQTQMVAHRFTPAMTDATSIKIKTVKNPNNKT
jgi:hypothetical protein